MVVKSLSELKTLIDRTNQVTLSLDKKIRNLWQKLPQPISPLASSLMKRDAHHQPFLNHRLSSGPETENFSNVFKTTLSLVAHAFNRFDFSYAVPNLLLATYHVYSVNVIEDDPLIFQVEHLKKCCNILISRFLQTLALYDEEVDTVTDVIKELVPSFSLEIKAIDANFIFAAFISRKAMLEVNFESARDILTRIETNEPVSKEDLANYSSFLALYSKWLNFLKETDLSTKIQSLYSSSFLISEELDSFIAIHDPSTIFNQLISQEIKATTNEINKTKYKQEPLRCLKIVPKLHKNSRNSVTIKKNLCTKFTQKPHKIVSVSRKRHETIKYYAKPTQTLNIANFTLYSMKKADITLNLKTAAESSFKMY